ncbi:MAG: AsmA family protein [Balneolales bacterium]|nr:AsmA family protein [Balneolales bacterium]
MKLFLKILGAIIALFLVFLIALNFYLTDERLRGMVVPVLADVSGREIQVDRISYTLFRSFPRFSLVIEGIDVPDTDDAAMRGENTRGGLGLTEQSSAEVRSLARVERLLVAVELFPLLSGNVNVNRLDVDSPYFNYVIYQDGRTNLDSLLEFMATGDEEDVSETQSTTEIDLQQLIIRNGQFSYSDHSSQMFAALNGVNSTIALRYGELITTNIELEMESLRVRSGSDILINNLPLSLSQQSTIDLEREIVQIQQSRLNIRGLDLDLEGEIADYTADAISLDLRINSSSDDFAALLEMVPDSFKEDLEGVQTSGSLVLNAEIKGLLGEDQLPDFTVVMGVENGFIQYPGVDSPIRDINIRIEADNSQVFIREFRAMAEANTLEASGRIDEPLEDSARFDLSFDLNLDLASISSFYPIDDVDLRGKMQMNANATGILTDAENANFTARILLENGYVKYLELDEPITDINVVLDATQAQITIESFAAKAAGNTLSLRGNIQEPLVEERTRFNLNAEMSMDLSTIPRFYPIDTDTLDMRGRFNFNGSANGRLADIENAAVNGNASLQNGYISYHMLPRPIDELSFRATISQQRIQLQQSAVKTGSNNFTANGSITDYLGENPNVDLNLTGEFNLAELEDYIDLAPYVNQIAGIANVNMRVIGPATDPAQLRFDGLFRMRDFSVAGDSLPQPITNLQANMVFSQEHVELRSFTMQMGESDFDFSGELRNYMRLIDEETSQLATLNARFKSQKINVDELWEFDEEPEEDVEYLIELPKLQMNLQVEIEELIFLQVPITTIRGTVESTDRRFAIRDASAALFEGTASGNLVWDVPRPDQTRINFNGSLTDLRLEQFFEQVKPAGLDDVHEYFSGRFSATVEYITDMDSFLDPIIPTTRSNGTFSMDRARVLNHPVQVQASDLLRSPSLRDLSLDDVEARYNIRNSVMTLESFNLTSQDIGLTLTGTQHLENEQINYTATIVLPGSLGSNLEPVLTREGVQALTREDGKIPIPLRVSGTTSSPSVGLDTSAIQERIQEFLRDSASDAVRNRLRNLFGN